MERTVKNSTSHSFGAHTIKMEDYSENGRDWFSCLCTRPLANTKIGRTKVVFNYKFSSDERRDSYVTDWKQAIERREASRKQRRAEVSERQKNMVNPFSLGDVLYSSWGYDQTNVDFFQIVEVKQKSILIRPINQEIDRAGYSSDSEFVKPVKDKFFGESVLKKLVCDRNGEVRIGSRHGSIRPYDGKPKFQSHSH